MTVSLLVGIAATVSLLLRIDGAPEILWERQLPESEYVRCLTTHEAAERAILVAGIQQSNYGSRDYDNYLVCLDIETGKELWRRKESKLGNLRGGKRPTSIDFDLSGDLIVGWDYLVGEGNYEVVSKHSAKDGAIIWEWKALSEGARSPRTGYSHGAWIFCEGTEVLVKTSRSVGNVNENSNIKESYSVIDSRSGTPVDGASSSHNTVEARWQSRENSLRFHDRDGREITWEIHRYEHTQTNWFRWYNDDGIWLPESNREQRERIQVTRIPPHSPATPEHFFVGQEMERVLLLLHGEGEIIPSAALIIDMSKEVQSRKWRIVEVTNESRIGRTLALGTGISHNYAGPIRLTKRGSVVVSGSLTQNQRAQRITVWK